jgi:Flp pilus assembly protein CpaB
VKNLICRAAVIALALAVFLVTGEASQQPTPAKPQAPASNGPTAPAGVPLPAGYVIGPDDVLSVLFWRDAEMSGDLRFGPTG